MLGRLCNPLFMVVGGCACNMKHLLVAGDVYQGVGKQSHCKTGT